MTHAHLTTWILAIIFFFIALGMHKSGKARGLKVMQMTLRLFYLLIIGTGVWIFSEIHNVDTLYIIKALAGLWVIAMFEMIIVRTVKGKSTAAFWVQLIIAFLLVLYLGLRLPLGFHPFL